MKKVKKVLAALLCAALLLAIPVSAAVAKPDEPQYAACPDCGGRMITRETREYQHDEVFPCRHYSEGTDRYAVYEVSKLLSCENCGVIDIVQYEEHILTCCNGYDPEENDE